MEEEKERRKSSLGSEKKKRRKSLFEWSKGEELNLLKKLVEFNSKNISREEFYPFLRNGSLAEVSKIQIFDKIQQLKREYLENKLELRKMRKRNVKLEEDDDDYNDKRDEGFELSNQLWGEVDETERASNSKALEVCSRNYYEGFFESCGLDVQLFDPSFHDATKKDIDHLFNLEHHVILSKAKLTAQILQLKYDLIQARVNNPTN
ncbi:hypothetical protein IC575_030055 [Cucumis melo]